MKKITLSCFVLILLAGCAPTVISPKAAIIESEDPSDYDILVPFDASTTRYNHGIYLGSVDLMDIGSRLQEHTKAVFSVDDYSLAEGQVLTITRVNNLLRRESADNPEGLNPAKGSQFATGFGATTILDAVLVADIVEINFYTGTAANPVLSGIALAIVFNQSQEVNGVQVSITSAKLTEYAQTVGRKLERYLRAIQGIENLDIYMGLYTTQKIDSTLPGHFFSEATFTAREGQFSAVNEEWVFFPSQTALDKDIPSSTAFNKLRSTIATFTPESVGTVGEGLYVDKTLDYLKITVSIQAKTYTEVYALTQTVVSLLDEFHHEKYDIIVKIESNFSTVALIELDKNDTLRVIFTY